MTSRRSLRVAVFLRHWSAAVLVTALGACGASPPPARPAPPQPIAVAAPKLYTEQEQATALDDICQIDPDACPTLDMEKEAFRGTIKEQIHAVQQTAGTASLGLGQLAAPAPPPAVPPQPIEVTKTRPARAEMIDVEAKVEIEVEQVAAALKRIRDLVSRFSGQIVNEVVENKPNSAGAALSLRVPTPQVQSLLAELERVGKFLSRKVESKDVGREYHDAQILLRNLQATLARYEELLKKANDPKEMLAIEEELGRVRTQIERVQGDIRYLSDRASRATVYVTLTALRPDSEVVEPQTKLYLGLRGHVPLDISDASGVRGFAGGGLSVMPSRGLSLDADWATRLRNSDGIQLFLITAGGDLYSDRLGGGRRRSFNPYVGLRLGYARLLGDDAFAVGGTLGLELWKSQAVMLEVQARAYALLGLEDAAHALIQPGAAFHVAY